MTRTRRSSTPEERFSLLHEAEREGYLETCRKHNLSPTLLSKWKQRYLAKGAEGLKLA
jgi:transposase-like protein